MTDEEREPHRPRAVDVAAILVGAVATFLVVWAGGIWLTNDGPQHLFASYARLHLDDPALGYSRFFEAASPGTALGFHAIFSLLEPLLGWRTAYRATLVVIAELWALGLVAVIAAWSPRRLWMGVLAFPTAFQLTFALGFLPFLVSNALGLFAVAAWIAVDKQAVRVVVGGALLFLAARAHVVGAGIAGAVVLAIALGDDRELLGRRLALVALSGAGALYVVVDTRLGEVTSEVQQWQGGGEELRWLPLSERLLSLFQVGPAWRGAGLLALVALGAVLAVKGTRRERAAGLVAGALVVASWLLPRDLLDWQLAGARTIPLGAAVLVSTVAIERLSTRARRGLQAAVAAYAVASLAWAWAWADDMRARASVVVDPLEGLAPSPRWFVPAVLDPYLGGNPEEIPELIPALHVGQLYAIVLGGEAAYGQADSRNIHLVVKKPRDDRVPPPRMDYWNVAPADRAALTRRLSVWLSLQPSVLVVGEPDDVTAFRAAGYRAELDTGRVMLATFEGCAGNIVVDGGAGKTAHVGAWPLRESAADVVLDDEGRGVVERVPCGDVWLQVDGTSCAVRTTWNAGADNALACSGAR